MRRKVLPHTLFGRSLMIIVTPVLLMQVIVAYVFFDRHWDSMTEKLVGNLTSEIHFATVMVETARGPQKRAEILAQVRDIFLLEAKVMPAAGLQDGVTPLTGRMARFGVDHRLDDALRKHLERPYVLSENASRPRWIDVRVPLENGAEMLVVSMPDKRLVSPTTYIFLLWMIGGSVVLFAIAVVLMRNQIRPIRRLAIVAEKLGRGQEVPDIRIVGAYEVRQASRAFMEMKNRLKRQIEQRTAMLAGVSHDLRTPLTRMKLQLAMSRDLPGVDDLHSDLEEMEKMIEGYLDFARGEGDETPEVTSLPVIVERVVANACRQGYRVDVMAEAGVSVRARPMALERALANIVMNAGKFASHVWVTAYRQGDVAEITVDDDGPGIPASAREEVFRPFFRMEKSRNKKTGGMGLGLSIAQDIVHHHGGEIFLEDSNRGGLRVVIRLPV